jgi:aspartate kinase
VTGAPAAARPVVVQKFGGTSVGSAEGRAAACERVRAAMAAARRPVVVVSAMGRAGAPYATDTLLGLLDDHEVVAREADLLAACGEVIAAVVVAHELRAGGVPAMAFTGAEAGVLTDDEHGDATVIRVDPAPLRAAIADGVVPVVAGFQGISPSGDTTTLGRGGSDTTACAIGAALAAEAVEIYTDVDGVMTADPRACPGVRVLDSLQFEELFQMARTGAKVVHSPAAETAMNAGIPVWVRNTYSAAPGTMVADAARLAAERERKVATAVSHADGIGRVAVTLPEGPERDATLTAIFRAMADGGVSLDMFTPVDGRLVFSLPEDQAGQATAILDGLGVHYAVREGLAKVTLVGAGMHGVPGVMARVAEALSRDGVHILQVADSHYTISVLVDATDSRRAIRSLHTAFGLGVDESGSSGAR